jgi:hypothetical protein
MTNDDRSVREVSMTRTDPDVDLAKLHAKHVRDFAYHLMTYVFVCTLLIVVDVLGGMGDRAILGLDWAYWIVLFWGFGVVGHAISVFLGDRRTVR